MAIHKESTGFKADIDKERLERNRDILHCQELLLGYKS